MKAIVLAGGHATRLWPITRHRAKPLLSLDGRPIIDYIVADLEDRDDIDTIYISTNRKFADDFREYIADNGYERTEVVTEDQASEEEKPGTIGAIIQLLDRMGADDDYLVIGGDNYYSFDLGDFLETADGRPAIACYDVGSKEAATSFGVVETTDGTVTGFEEKPSDPSSTLASIACYFFPEDTVSLFHEYEDHFRDTDVPADRYLDEPGRLIEWAHRQTDILAYPFEGNWFDVGTREGYLTAQAALAEGNTIDGDVTGTDVGDNVYVMAGATVRDADLEDCIIFPGASIEDCTIRGSIIDEDADLKGLDVAESLIGKHSTVRR
jgi:glucose-1-phosphate thymidylyltransferase